MDIFCLFGFSISLACLELIFATCFGNLILSDSLKYKGLLLFILAELALKVFEEGSRADLDVSDLDSLKPHTPSSGHLLEGSHDLVFEFLTIFDNFIDSRVSDLVSNDCGRHLDEQFVGGSGGLGCKIASQVFVSLHRSIVDAVYGPHDHG